MSADAKLMGCPLMSDHLLLTCLGQSLVQLDLTVYPDDPPYDDFDMDCLSNLSRLQHLHIQSAATGQNRTWKTQGLLSSLTALESFRFLGDDPLQGPVMPALGSLNKLTALVTAHIPQGYVEVCRTHFSVLTKFAIKHNSAVEKLRLDIAFAQSIHSLCKLSLHGCCITSSPLHLKSLSSLTKVKFDRCEFKFEDWLSEALEGATQVQILTLHSMHLTDIPISVCRMTGLRQLNMLYTYLSDLPAHLAQLTNLEFLDLSGNDLTSVPVVLEQMTHLVMLDLTRFQAAMQLTRPLTFLSAFPNLRRLYLSEPEEAWNSLSMFHIGQLRAALAERSRHLSARNKPRISYSKC